MAILKTENLSKHFGGVYAVSQLSVGFEKGAITGIIGPNGSGKSTLTNLLTGVHAFDKGAVILDGVSLKKIKSCDLPVYGLTRTFQEIRLFEQMPVLDNLLITLTERGVFSALFEKHSQFHLNKAEEILKKVGLWEKRHALAINLSYGQRKLLEIGRVLAMNSEIVIFDEPFAGLFKEMAKIVVDIMKELKTEGKTLVLIEHNMELIRELCDHLYVMDEGKLLAQGRPTKVLAERKVIEAYLGE